MSRVLARRLGYANVSAGLRVEGGDTLRPAFALGPVPRQLATVRTSAVYATSRLGDFEKRRARKVGHFITEAEIDRRNPVYLSNMLRAVLSVTINDRGNKQVALSLRTPAGCPFQIFVDGLMFDEDGDLTLAPSPKDIAGVEVHSGPTSIPLEYKRANTQCGVILIWTKSGR